MTPRAVFRRSAVRQIRSTFFTLAVILTLSACGVFGGGSDGTDVQVAEDVDAQPTVNSVQAVPAQTPTPAGQAAAADPATAALPTAVTLPTAAPTPEPTIDRSQPSTYVVQSGDVLGLIAERFDADIDELRRVNNLDGNLIRVGQELTIPAVASQAAAAAETTESAAETTESAADPAPAAPAAPAAPVSCNSAASGHCIQPGESLLGIALQYDVSVDALRAANPGITGDLIRSGQVLNLPGAGTAAAAVDPAPAAAVDPGPGVAAAPAVVVGPANDADCQARNPEFPYFHAADGLCYANPIGSTPVPTSAAANAIAIDDANETSCEEGTFLWTDGLCYPIPGVTVVAATATVTATPDTGGVITGGSGSIVEDYGRPPCRDGYVELVTTNVCWPEAANLNPTTVTPTPTP